MEWRVLPLETCSPEFAMARAQAVYEGNERETSPPTIYFYYWKEPGAISLAYNQNRTTVNVAACTQDNIEIVWRCSSGNTAVHHPGDITYYIAAPFKLLNTVSLDRGIYRTVCGWAVNGLRNYGIEAKHLGLNDISIFHNGEYRKVVGSANKWTVDRKDLVLSFMQHGNVFSYVTPELMAKYSTKDLEMLKQTCSSLSSVYPDFDSHRLYEALFKTFTKNEVVKSFYRGQLNSTERARINELIETKEHTKQPLEEAFTKDGNLCATDQRND